MGDPESISPEAMKGKVLKDRYELQEFIEEGGMGHVYKSFDRTLQRTVAVKILSNIEALEMVRRFEREAKTLSSLHHPNVAAIFDYGVEGNQPFMVMEYIEGKTVSQFIADKIPPSTDQSINWIKQIGEGLAAAHDQGIVHRDIKPENLLVTIQGGNERVVIIDFGLAISDFKNHDQTRLTSSRIVMGTQRYMPPEQMEGHPATPQSDIYAFGLVCAELIAGPQSVVAGRLKSTINPPDRAKDYWPIIVRACKEEPSERWPRLRSMIHALENIKKVSTPKSLEHGSDGTKKSIFNKSQVIVAFLFFLLLAGGFYLGDSILHPPEPVPVVSIDETVLSWSSKETLEVRVHGNVLKSQAHRMIIEFAVCDTTGTRVTSPNGVLIDHAIGVSQALDIVNAPQSFERTVKIQIPKNQIRGYVSVTILDSSNLIIAQQSSAFWPERP